MSSTPTARQLHAFWLASDDAAARYKEAAQQARVLAERATALARLVAQHPSRVDYRAAFRKTLTDSAAAAQRAQSAHRSWQATTFRADSAWTKTQAGAA
ncbi:hypothetical protein M8C13_40335 [Crossiella sp. SN42]|uniref:hypothetical protein n=1 Tax=Crossiella sp. SN42 TaxID=2944808 RepID=UPI00207D1AEB|nr:hypothetical protein [Crossiella sp. SN42]MCO1582016.1 hypothetical protein [Crossiella sp. SN42]